MKLSQALFREPNKAFKVIDQSQEDEDDFLDWNEREPEDFLNWDVEPLSGATLARDYVQGPFEGLFIVAGKLITKEGAVHDCYLDVVLPERISEHYFVKINEEIVRGHGNRVGMGTAIPAIAIEKFGVHLLFHAPENPGFGVEVLRNGLRQAHQKKDIARDLLYLLRDEKRYEEAIEAISIILNEDPEANIYQDRSLMYEAMGQHDKAEEDKRLWAIAFQKRYARAPRAEESPWYVDPKKHP